MTLAMPDRSPQPGYHPSTDALSDPIPSNARSTTSRWTPPTRPHRPSDTGKTKSSAAV
jgi:hypothetical protein